MIDPTEKYWIEKYIEIRSEFDFLNGIPTKLDFQQKLYKYLQPLGIIYGHPIDLPAELNIDTGDWPVKQKLEVIFYESLLASFLLKNNLKGSTEDLKSVSIQILKFYDKLDLNLSKKSFFESKAKSDFETLERVFKKRVNVKAEWNNNFWQGFFHNILLFVDVITFIEYLNNPDLSDEDLLNYEKNTHVQIIHMLSTILDINKETKDINVKYFHYFVESTILDKEEKKQAMKWHLKSFDKEFKSSYDKSSWLKRKYILDLAVLSVWADHSVSLLEEEMLDTLVSRLQLDNIDLEASGFAVESFVLDNWNKVHFLQQKQSFLVLSKRITERMKKISAKYSSIIKQEIAEDKELVRLLKLSQERPLSPDEKDKVRRQLVDVLKSIPTFLMLAMPMAFLTVPILMRIIPKELFPSSFNPNALSVSRRNRIIEG